MAVGPTKNARDPWLRFKVWDLQGTGVLNRYVLVEWVADQALFANPGARTPETAWPFSAGTELLAIQYVTVVPAYLYVPQESWDVLNRYRALWWRLSYGSTQVPDAAWISYPPGQLIINHPPLANPGPPRVFQLDPNDRLIDPLRLDGSGTTDDDMAVSLGLLRDPGPLAFKWEVAAGPAPTQLPWQTANFSQATAVALPANTQVPPAALGTYTFRLRVQDTDTPLATSTAGVDVIEVQHTLQRFGGGVFIFSPSTFAPRTFQLVEDLDVPITYKLDPGLLTDPAFQGGYWAQLDIEEATTGSSVMTRVTPVPPTDFEGHFGWNGIYDDGAQPVSGQQFHVRVRLLDYNGAPMVIAGRKTEDLQQNAIRINVTSVTIQPTATKAASFDKLIAGMASVSLPITISTPAGAQAPDSLSLEVSVENVLLGTVPIAGLPNLVTWKGSTGGATRIPAPDHYDLQIVARRGGKILSRSNKHNVKVVRVEVTLADPAQSALGALTIHPIDSGGPTMPGLTVTVRIRGLTNDEELAQTRDVRLSVSHREGDRADDTFLPGPGGGSWQTLGAGTWQWIPAWGPRFCGGDLVAFSRAFVDGVLVEGDSGASHRIWGLNPPKATIRGAYGGLNMQVVGWQESRFNQFRNTTATGALNVYDPGPFSVLVHVDPGGTFGYGIGALTIPSPTVQEVWSWTANVAASITHLNGNIAQAQAFRAATPVAPNFTADQLDLEMWCRYNSNRAYHDFDPVTSSWIRGASAAGTPRARGQAYADTCLGIRNQVAAGMPPAGW